MSQIQTVTLEQLQRLAATAQKNQEPARLTTARNDGRFDLAAYLNHYGCKVVKVVEKSGYTLYVFPECLFDPSHRGKEAGIGQGSDGKLFYQCFHTSCKGRTWADARQTISGSDSLARFTTFTGNHRERTAPGPAAREEQVPPPPSGCTAADLIQKEFREPRWVIPSILPEGLATLGGPPKTMKSFMALNMGIAIGAGGRALGVFDVEPGRVLYLALEDTERRLKKRLLSCCPNGDVPEKLHLFTEWPRVDQGGITHLLTWLGEHADTRLVIIDTLTKLRPAKAKRNDGLTLYDHDYHYIGSLKQIADAHRVCILCIHHLSKGEKTDPLEQLSGSMGISGAADTIWILKRARGTLDATLFVTGRDLEEEKEHALRFDRDITTWRLLGDASAYQRSMEQVAILDLLRDAGEPLQLGDILQSLGKKKRNVLNLLNALEKDGLVTKASRGKYTLSQKVYLDTTLSTPSSITSLTAPTAPSEKWCSDTPKGAVPPLHLFSEDSCGLGAEVHKVQWVHNKSEIEEGTI